MKKAKNQTKTTSNFILSDYIMSSHDIAKAINLDHDKMMKRIFEVHRLGGVLIDYYFRPVLADINNEPIQVYLFDFETVSDLAGYIARKGDNVREMRQKILMRYFELAANPTTISEDLYRSIYRKMTDESERFQRFQERVRNCAIAVEDAKRQAV